MPFKYKLTGASFTSLIVISKVSDLDRGGSPLSEQLTFTKPKQKKPIQQKNFICMQYNSLQEIIARCALQSFHPIVIKRPDKTMMYIKLDSLTKAMHFL